MTAPMNDKKAKARETRKRRIECDHMWLKIQPDRSSICSFCAKVFAKNKQPLLIVEATP